MKKGEISWKCVCGANVRVMENLLKSGGAVCSKCKSILDPSPMDVPEASASDTQMINIEEMARMAQEGVEMDTSGEWDTSDPKVPAKKGNRKK